MILKNVKVSQLKLGDKVKWFDGPFGTAIVSRIGDNATVVELFRPYAVLSACSSPLMGFETGVYFYDSKATFEVERDS